MPAISKIRLTNVVYEDGDKRFNDDIFLLDGHNGAIILENGGGKTVLIHTVLQAVLPHTNLGDRKIRETLQLDQAPAHVAIEWIVSEHPRRYLVTAVSLFLENNKLQSYKYAFEYEHGNADRIEQIPFAIETKINHRPAYKEEISDYYSQMRNKSQFNAKTFDTLADFHTYIEEQYQIIHTEWESIVKINRDEGGIEKFFERCKTTTDLYDRLLIPIVEDSIAGHEKQTFADTFEKQRTAFQTYRNLQKSMAEHELIQRELESYVQEVKQFSDLQASYNVAMQHAKGLLETIVNEKLAIQKEQTENEGNWKMWESDQEDYEMKQASFHILKEREKLYRFETTYLEQLELHDDVKERLDENTQLYYSLKHAKAKQAITIHKQLLKQYQEDLAKHEDESDIDEYKDELAQQDGKLHGYFLAKIEQLEKEIEQTKYERRPLEDTLESLMKKLQQLEADRGEITQQSNRVEGQMETKHEQLDRLKQVLANPDQEDMKTEFERWTERRQWLDEEIIKLNEWKKTADQSITEMSAEREDLQKQMHEVDINLHDKQSAENQMNQAHNQVIEKLAGIRPNWKTIADLHLQESRVYGALCDTEAKLHRDHEDVLYKERLAHRFVDDYDEQDLFFTDPFLAERLTNWQNQFYVVSGAEYYESLSKAEKEVYKSYPLWPVTLVTIATDRTKLLDHLRQISERLQYPISVLTIEQVKQYGDGDIDGTWITPYHWETNLNREEFGVWKGKLREIADKTTWQRKEKEAEIEQHAVVIRKFEDFFKTYPRDVKEQLREDIRQTEAEKKAIGREMEKLVTEITTKKQDIEVTQEQVGQYESEMVGITGKIEKGVEYFQVERDLNELTKERTVLEQKVADQTKEIQQISREIERYEADKQRLDGQINDNETDLFVVKENSLYKEVNDTHPIYTDEDEAVINRRRESLQLQIHGIQQAYGELVTKYERAEEDIARGQQVMADLKRDHDEIDVDLSFPVDGERLLERARQDMHEGQMEVAALVKEIDKAKEPFVRQDALVTQDIENFQAQFTREEVYEFGLTIGEIEAYLSNEQTLLNDRKQYLQVEQNRIDKELQDIYEAEQHIDKYSIAHHFKSTILTPIPLTESERTEYTYARMTFAENVTTHLEETDRKLTKGKDRIERAKDYFRSFIRREVTEPKLREMAREGIEIKTTYEDILKHQENMLTTLESADRYARDFISKNDELVQAFINNIHNHLMNVTEQLKVIPKHTQVRVGEKWRDIYRFNIPEWTEEEGKSRIRDYMDWILEQLESDRFKDSQGLEDTGKARKEIETWLDTKQLLQVVMEQQAMKVSCRKVTNDNQVTQRLTTWEQSNQWSGGEKWSKNMTLFLGILNFVAEKKQHLNKNTKRHRAVILDNPFGKASSDHVLSPVFFIAEQLGFQIIALTAHADGKFLQDYFPIIYSLRLRTASDGRKQVMGKEKSLHHAYFQDHDPVVMERLEEREQMELF